jgi:hypothetical protein
MDELYLSPRVEMRYDDFLLKFGARLVFVEGWKYLEFDSPEEEVLFILKFS